MPPPRRRGTRSPDPEALSSLSRPGRLTKAPAVDPVLGAVEPAARPDTPATPSPSRAREQSGTRAKVGFYADADDVDRWRAAFANLPADVRPRSYSDFLAAAVMDRVRQLEAEYNDGRPWEPRPSGSITTGRPLQR